MYILSNEQFKEVRKLTDWVINQVGKVPMPQDVQAAASVPIKVAAFHKEVDIDKAEAVLEQHLPAIIKEIRDILEDGKVTLGDLGDGLSLFRILSTVVGDYPELSQELKRLNELETQILGAKLFSLINDNLRLG